jgi:hypothetical protein
MRQKQMDRRDGAMLEVDASARVDLSGKGARQG